MMGKINGGNSVENDYRVIAMGTKGNEIGQKRIFNIKGGKSNSILEIATGRLGENPMAKEYGYTIVTIIEDTKGKTGRIIYQSFTEDEL
ncbi:MAG: hypothetical protein WC850_01315 [Candidatus Gracilibacteria bacterium]